MLDLLMWDHSNLNVLAASETLQQVQQVNNSFV